jgi:hypothetical protein
MRVRTIRGRMEKVVSDRLARRSLSPESERKSEAENRRQYNAGGSTNIGLQEEFQRFHVERTMQL